MINFLLIKKLKKKILEFWNNYLNEHSNISYSQEGEDLILNRIFESKKDGFYIDIGAHHPKRFSNTYLFYKKGWKGINIDAMPGSMKLFNFFRPRDVNIETPISSNSEELTYYIFNEPALNGFSKELSEERNKLDHYKIVSSEKLKTKTLKEILTENLDKHQVIDFMTIDVEGMELEVIKSNDWKSFKPKVLLLELKDQIIEDLMLDEIKLFLKVQNYDLYAKTVHSVFFKRKDLQNN